MCTINFEKSLLPRSLLCIGVGKGGGGGANGPRNIYARGAWPPQNNMFAHVHRLLNNYACVVSTGITAFAMMASISRKRGLESPITAFPQRSVQALKSFGFKTNLYRPPQFLELSYSTAMCSFPDPPLLA